MMRSLRLSVMLVLGILIVVGSIFAAMSFEYQSFYAFLLVGMVLALDSAYEMLSGSKLWRVGDLVRIYVTYVIIGIVVDLMWGIWITKLWHYPMYTWADFARLYLFIYPAGGVVMIYTFLVLETVIVGRARAVAAAQRQSLIVPLVILAGGVLLFLVAAVFTNVVRAFGMLSGMIAVGIGLTLILTRRVRGYNMVGLFETAPWRYTVVVLIGAYTQGMIHEVPNVVAKEWVYMNWPLQGVTIMGVPLLVLMFGWIGLLVAPYALWELVVDKRQIYERRGSP